MVATVEAAAISPQGIVYSPGKSAIPTGRVWTLGSVITMSAKKNSFHAWIKTNSATVRIPSTASGRITLYNAYSQLQPSTSAASSISLGTSRKKVVRIQTTKGNEKAM